MLTNERIDRMVGRTNWLLLTFANGTQSIALDPVAARNFARAIEAEVLQSQELVGGITPFNPLNAASNVLPCRAQNAIHAPQDVLQNADATQAQEPVAWFAFADNNGPVPLELWGFDLKACKNAVLENARSAGWKGTVEGYLFQNDWTIKPLYTNPQPPEPCPKCAENVQDAIDWMKRALKTEGERDALQAKVAEQSAEIGRLTKERDEYNSAWQRSGVEYRKLRDSLLSLAGEFK